MKWKIKKKKRIQLFYVCFCFVCLTSCRFQSDFERSLAENAAVETTDLSEESEKMESMSTASGEIFIHVCGCVKNPGLYELPSGTRAGEAIEKAGGFTKEADSTAVNLAQLLDDGLQLYVPSKKEKQGQIMSDEVKEEYGSEVGRGKVNLNTASLQELTSLSGIGETRAEAILSYRKENGSFSSIEDIKNVSGIGDGIFEKIKDSITV